jgi:MoaA/NifB/PqqE/SkfB family radical SAM enzyme
MVGRQLICGPGISYRSESFGGLLYDRLQLDYVPVSHLGYAVLRLAGQTARLDAICDRLARRYPGQDPAQVRSDVVTFLNQLAACGMLELIPALPGGQFIPAPADGLPPYPIVPSPVGPDLSTALRSLKAPLIVQLAVIFTCNLLCAHCYTSSTAEHRPDTLTFTEICGIIDDAARCEVFDLSLTGGEALLRSDICDIIAYAKRYPLFVNLNSNGTPITPRVARQLAEAGLDQARVSIDSASAEIHDAFRGRPGALKATLRGIGRLVDAGLRTEVHVTLSAEAGHTRADVDALIALARQLGVQRISFGSVNAVGRADDDAGALKVRDEPLNDLVAYIEALSRLDPLVGGAPQARHPSFPGLPGYDGCGNCFDSPLSYINYNGDMFPCPSMYKPEYSLGSVRQHGFAQIWRSSPTLAQLRQLAGPRIADGRQSPEGPARP